MFEKKKPSSSDSQPNIPSVASTAPFPAKDAVRDLTFVETKLPATPLADVPNYPAAPPVNPPTAAFAIADPPEAGKPTVTPTITMADLMLELEVIGEIFKKRKIYSVQSLKMENGRFTLTCSWIPEPGAEMRRFIGRSISSSLTPKGLAMVMEEMKAGVGL